MQITIQFFSHLQELTGCAAVTESPATGCTLDGLYDRVLLRFPQLAPLRKSTLLAVGVDYQPRDYVLQDGDVVSFLPPVQGG